MIIAQKKPRYLVLLDFDGTLFNTFDPSPHGMDVEEAYALSLRDLFGKNTAKIFKTQGLNNRTPTQIVYDLFADGTPADTIRFNMVAAILVQRKLEYLLGEIGQRNPDGKMWPQPCKGALNFLNQLYSLKKRGTPLDVGIISSGHRKFIQKTLDAWGIPHPDILVTDDDIRPRKYPKELERRCKPGQLPLALTHYEWIQNQGLISHDIDTEGNALVTLGEETKKRIIYIGNDLHKDVGMATRGRVVGFLYPFTSYETLGEAFVSKDAFDGRPFKDIVLSAESRIPVLENPRPAYAMERR